MFLEWCLLFQLFAVALMLFMLQCYSAVLGVVSKFAFAIRFQITDVDFKLNLTLECSLALLSCVRGITNFQAFCIVKQNLLRLHLKRQQHEWSIVHTFICIWVIQFILKCINSLLFLAIADCLARYSWRLQNQLTSSSQLMETGFQFDQRRKKSR